MYTLLAYIIYLAFSIITVFVVGKNLHRNGKNFLFGECADVALSTSSNNFLYLGYCMVNTAFALCFLTSAHSIKSMAEVMEFIAASQGIIFITLGFLHYINILFAPKIINYFLKKKL